jgi:hypothetical protein
MGGLIFFAVIGIWFFIVLGVIVWIAKKLPERWWRTPLSLLLFIVVLILPIIDEIVGGWQFKRLCEANSEIQVDKAMAVGKTVYLAEAPDVEIKSAWMRVVLKPWMFLDVATDDLIISYNTLKANNSFLGKYMSQEGVPILFKGWCEPGGIVDPIKLFENLGVIYVERSTLN